MWHDADGMGWWMLWGGLMMLLFWGGLIVLVVWLAQSVAGAGKSAGTPAVDSPLEIAKQRYARGELTRDEFAQIKSDLSAEGPRSAEAGRGNPSG